MMEEGASPPEPCPESPPASGMHPPSAAAPPAACPFCHSALSPGALKCAACGSNVGDIKLCPACAEPVRSWAALCPHCRTDLRPPPDPRAARVLAEPWVIEASGVGSFISEKAPTSLFFPPRLTVTDEEIHIHRRLAFGLQSLEQKIAVSRVASVRALHGVFWGGIIVETFGGAAGVLSIQGLDKEEAKQAAALIERLANLRRG